MRFNKKRFNYQFLIILLSLFLFSFSLGRGKDETLVSKAKELYNKGRIFMKQEDFGEAARNFEKSLEILNGQGLFYRSRDFLPSCYRQLADAYMQLGYYDKVEKALNLAIKSLKLDFESTTPSMNLWGYYAEYYRILSTSLDRYIYQLVNIQKHMSA